MFRKITRRKFLKGASIAVAGSFFGTGLIERALSGADALAETGYFKEALHYRAIDNDTVECVLCPRRCVLKNGQRSPCRVREPRNGKLYSLVYELPCSIHVDPIEKKPLYHVLPASRSFSIATAGCNLRCKYCQNWQISQENPENVVERYLPCEEVVNAAQRERCASIAYTYSEPIVFYEYMYDTSKLAKAKGIKNVWVTSGFINPDPLKELSGVIDAANIDLKGFSESFMREVCGARLEPVLETIKMARENGIWVELTNLLIPTLNDDPAMIKNMCAWIRENLGKEVPIHFSRFWPMYKLKNLPPTPVETLHMAREIAQKEGLYFAYIGNVPQDPGNNTYCPRCKKIVVGRAGYFVMENNVVGSKCKFCGYPIAGIWE